MFLGVFANLIPDPMVANTIFPSSNITVKIPMPVLMLDLPARKVIAELLTADVSMVI